MPRMPCSPACSSAGRVTALRTVELAQPRPESEDQRFLFLLAVNCLSLAHGVPAPQKKFYSEDELYDMPSERWRGAGERCGMKRLFGTDLKIASPSTGRHCRVGDSTTQGSRISRFAVCRVFSSMPSG